MQGPLYRVVNLRRAANDHVLAFVIHHAVADGWSLGLFVEELFAGYLQGIAGSSEALPPAPQTYAAWGAAERAFWKPEMLEQRIGFWKARLAASNRMWNATITPGPARRWLSAIPASLTNETRELARRTGVTLFSTLFGAFQIAFSKWSGFDDLVVGTPVANRTRQTARETMGYYAGIVPLRGQIDLSRVASDHLRAAHQLTIDSFANAMPFLELVRGIGEQTAAGYNPLFEVRFALQNHPMPEVSLPNLSARLRMRSTGTARFQIGCEITENREGLEVAWLFRENLFSQHDIESLNGIFQRVLAGICRSPESRISELLNRPQ
ncbi:MAG TPA: condensation domain-containing protein [Chthoniobacterales bacterium]|nr:condensation domain-containing protein [Chthoniobacterales bacterium]